MRKAAIFLNHPKCSVQSVNGIIEALDNFSFKIFTRHQLEPGFFSDVSLVIFPGGIGDSDSFDTLLKFNKLEIIDKVKSGLPYLGLCMGAYWCDQFYFNLLKDTRVVQYIKQPNSCTRRPHTKNMPVIWEGTEYNMFFYDGCTFVGGKYETIASYKNTGMPMAIRQNNIGLIGCHPESTQHWYNSYRYMKKYWHRGSHHALLKRFALQLVT